MKTNKFLLLMTLFSAVCWMSACTKEDDLSDKTSPFQPTSLKSFAVEDGRPGTADVYHDGALFLMYMKKLPAAAAATMVVQSRSIHELYVSNELIPGRNTFTMVSDDVEGEGSYPLWRAIEIEFKKGYEPRQFTSTEDIYAAVNSDEIILKATDDMYLFSLIGPRQQQ